MTPADRHHRSRARADRRLGCAAQLWQPWAPSRLRLLLAGSALSVSMAAPGLAASMPPLPPARQVLYDPDPAICKPASLQNNFRQQLLPWADQPAAVQAKLRQVQLELLQATLQRCVSKGLLSPEQAGTLGKELLGEAPTQPSGARP